jgi:hypothetical protein
MRDPHPSRKGAKSDVTCDNCGHTWEADGYEEGNHFDTDERCPECDEEYN